MSKTRNFKTNSLNSGDTIKLKSIINEVNRMQNREVSKLKKYAVINERALNGILKSGVLTLEESKSVRLYFAHKKITKINESVVRRVDSDLKIISEGFFDFFKKLGDKAKTAFETGWSAVKAIWKNFSDLVKEFIEKMKEVFKKIKDWVTQQVKSLATKITSIVNEKFIKKFMEEHPHEPSDLKKEIQQTKQTADHLTKYFTGNLENGEMYSQKLLDGSVDPKEDTGGVPESEVDKAAEELKKESYQIYNSIFSNKQSLKELMTIHLTEGGHLTDKIKNPIVQKIVTFLVNMVKVIFSPFSTIIGKLSELMVKKFMAGASNLCKKLDGPGIFEFVIMSVLVAETFEAVEDLLLPLFGFKNLLAVVNPFLGPLAGIMEGVHVAYHLGHLAVGAYALLTVVYNVSTLFSKSEEQSGGEPEVQTAGYKPKGQFKMKEGKLVFIS